MFTRSSNSDRAMLADIKPLDQRVGHSTAPDRNLPPSIGPNGNGGGSGQVVTGLVPPSGFGAAPNVVGSFSTRSIIGNDLTIMGQGLRIITKGTLQVDGKIEGDVIGSEVIIGEHGHVTGIVSGESVTVRGQVQGTIKAMTVALQSGAHVEGDVHHRHLSVEQGAHLDGRVRRPQDLSELKPDLAGI